MFKPEPPIDTSKEPPNNRDEFWMALKTLPVLVAVVVLHQLGPMSFWSAVGLGIPLGTVVGWFMVPMTRRLMKTRYAPIINLRLGEHPTDSGCGAYMFIFFALMVYQLFFVSLPEQRAAREAKKSQRQNR